MKGVRSVLVTAVLWVGVLATGCGSDLADNHDASGGGGRAAAVVSLPGACRPAAGGRGHRRHSRHILVTTGLVQALLRRYDAVYVHLCATPDHRAWALLRRIHAGTPVHPLHLEVARAGASTAQPDDELLEAAAKLFTGQILVIGLPDVREEAGLWQDGAWAEGLLDMGMTEEERMYLSARAPIAHLWSGLRDASPAWRHEEVRGAGIAIASCSAAVGAYPSTACVLHAS